MRLGPFASIALFLLMSLWSVPAPAQASFKVGDHVQVNSPWGWIEATVQRVNGNSYFVHSAAGDFWKSYPDDVRGTGAMNAQDRANGHYQLHDRVQVNVQGQWLEGEIITTMGTDYQVKLKDNREAWANPSQLRFVGEAQAPPVAKGGQPPAPGMTLCGAKLQGRYSSSGGGFGMFSVVINGGKATVGGPGGADEVLECWTKGSKIILHKPGSSEEDMSIDINDDGTLDTPLGEIKRKGSS